MPHDRVPPDLSAVVPVILAGGIGRRLWPLSTPAKPKPFIRLSGRQSLLQKTAARVSDMKAPIIVCNTRHRALVTEQVKAGQIILEPQARGTAPAIAAAAHYLAAQGDALMLVLPADHAIGAPKVLLDAVGRGLAAARAGMLVTFGVAPRAPSPHFGYIEGGEGLENGALRIASFVEKPGKAAARDFIRRGGYYWNSGIFLFSARTYLEKLKAQQPDIHDQSFRAVRSASRLQNAIFLNKEFFCACPALSIDYAVMENASSCAVIPVSMGWRDLGTWPSLLATLFKRQVYD